MKPFKYLLYGTGVLVLLAVIAAASFALLFDPNKFKGEIERVVKEQKQRTLRLEGDIKLAFYPNLGMSLGKTTLSEQNSPKEFASVESAHVSVALLPLLSGRAIVDEIRLAGLKANFVRGRDGKSNLDDLFESSHAPTARPSAESAKLGFDISSVRIERSSLAYKDEKTGQILGISEFGLRTGRIANDVPAKFELGAALKNSTPVIDAKIKASGAYRFNLDAKSLSLSGLDAVLAGSAAGLTELDARLKGDVSANALKNEYSVAGLSIEAKAATGKDRMEVKLSAPKLSLTTDKASSASVSAEFSLKGTDRSAKAVLKMPGADGSSKAIAVTEFSLDLILDSPALPQKTLTLPIRGSLRADLSKGTVTTDLATRFDDSSIQAKLGVLKFSPLATTFDINIDRLDVDKYLPPDAASAKPNAPAGDPQVDLGGLKTLQTSGRLSIGALTVSKIKLTAVKAEVRAANGRLEVNPHSANLYEGTLSGTLTANANGNQISSKESLNGISIGPLVRDLTGRDAIEGKGNVAIDVKTAGSTLSALKKALSGSANVHLGNGAIKGINLAEVLRTAKAAIGSKTAQRQIAKGGEQTDFSELSASFAIRNGVAHNEDLQAKAPLFRLTGSGDIDIGGSQLNYVARATVVSTAQGQGGADLASLKGLTIPVKLNGPFDSPRFEIDYAAVVAGAVTEKVKQSVGEKIKKSIGGSLKGLFGK